MYPYAAVDTNQSLALHDACSGMLVEFEHLHKTVCPVGQVLSRTWVLGVYSV